MTPSAKAKISEAAEKHYMSIPNYEPLVFDQVFEAGAHFGYKLAQDEARELVEAAKEMALALKYIKNITPDESATNPTWWLKRMRERASEALANYEAKLKEQE